MPNGVMQFGPFQNAQFEKILEVPLGSIETHASIRLTVGLDSTAANVPTDHDLTFAISDGTNENQITTVDPGSYIDTSPCRLLAGTHTNNLVSRNVQYPAQFTMIFRPFFKYGACYTAQNGGYVNVGKFAAQIDTTKPLSLVVRRDNDPGEQYKIYLLPLG